MSNPVKPPISALPVTERRRGRPPSLAARDAILAATRVLLTEGGLGAVTVEAVAARARVGKPTIYRHWTNATALAMAALIDAPAPETRVSASASPLADLRRQLARVAAAFSTPRGRQIGQMLAAAQADSEIARTFRHSVILRSRHEGKILLERAVAAGEISLPADIEVTLDLIYGPVFYRLLIGHAPLDAAFTDGLLLTLLGGLAPARVAR